MKFWYTTFTICMVALLSLAACGGGSDGGSKGSDGTSTRAGEPMSLDDADSVPFADVLAQAGFKPIALKRFPAQIPGRKARVLVYRHKSDKKRGGALYLQGRTADELGISWHWYFEDGAPDSLEAQELNGDGLWDVIVHFPGGESRELIQDIDFTLSTQERADRIALNAKSSQPDGLWRCFDGDTTTVWKAGDGEGYVEVPAPLGVADGILVVRLSAEARNPSCEVYADGKKVQDVALEATDLEQRVQLDEAVKKADTVKLVIKGEGAGISELAIR